MKRSLSFRLLIISVLATLVIFTSCTKSKEQALQEVRFGSFSVAVDYGPYLVAKNKGWFDEVLKEKGIKASYTLFQSLPPINESFATGRVDIVFEAESPAIVGKAAGIDIKIVGISCSLIQEIIIPKDSAVKSLEDLKGKKIAVLAGTGSHYGLVKVVKSAGLQPSDIEVIDMIPPDAKNAFQTGKIDAWAVWPPWVEQEEIAGTGRVLEGGDAAIHSIAAVRGKFAKEYSDILREILNVLDKAKKWISDNPVEAKNIVAKELNIPLEVVEKAWPRHDWLAIIDENVIKDIQEKADFLMQINSIRNPVKVKDELIDLSYGK